MNKNIPASCGICDLIPEFSCENRNDGSVLPEAAKKLKDLNERLTRDYVMSGTKEYTILKACPLCGEKYEYRYYYDYSPGYIEEIVTLKKL